jgi:hypothetical protein
VEEVTNPKPLPGCGLYSSQLIQPGSFLPGGLPCNYGGINSEHWRLYMST